MKRRTFLKSVLAGTAAGLCKGDERPTTPKTRASLDPAAVARELAGHRIAKIEAKRSNDRYARRLGKSRTGKGFGRGFGRQIRILTTDQGVKVGAMSWWPYDKVRRFVGTKVSDLFDLAQGTVDDATPLDFPLHDLVGHILNRPVCDLLGNHGPRKVPIYSAAIYFDDLEETDRQRGIERLLASCQDDYDTGYRAFKLKLGRGVKWMSKREGQRRDIEVTLAVAERFDDCKIIVDANNSYSVEDFMAYVTGVKDAGLYIIEEPFPENRDGLRRLRDLMAKVGCEALIMEGESVTVSRAGGGPPQKRWRYGSFPREHIEQLFALADEGLVDVFNMDLTDVGFTGWRRVMKDLVREGVTASPHTWAGTPPALLLRPPRRRCRQRADCRRDSRHGHRHGLLGVAVR